MAQTKIKAGLFEGVIGNGTDGYFLMSNGDGTMTWASTIINPAITSIAYPGSVTAADPAGGETITVTGTGFQTGATVTIGGTAAPAVSYVSATQITFTTPAKAAGDYDIVITNTDTGSATFINGISYNGIPTWTTAAGSLGTFDSDTTISTITLQATEPDAGTITFSITNGALPTGLSLTGANIDGTTSLETADTLYTFTVTATDDESQATPRTFTITVTKRFISTENFTINTYVGDSAFPQTIEGGKIGTAASFDGSSSKILIGEFAGLNTSDYSVSLWFNHDSTDTSTSNKRLIQLNCSSAGDAGLLDVMFKQSTFEFTIRSGSSATNILTYTSNATELPDNTWNHIAVTRDNTSNLTTLYINGTNVKEQTQAEGSTFGAFSSIGSRTDGGLQVLGKIDQVRIFNTELNSTKITTLYGESNNSTNKSTTDIFDDGSGIALYEFEEGAKDTGVAGTAIDSGQSGDFDGTNYLTTPYTIGNTFSVSYWFKTTATGEVSIIGNGGGSGSQRGFQVSVVSGSLKIYFSEGGTDSYTSSNTHNDGLWHNVVLTDNNGTFNTYVDGVLDSNLSGTTSYYTSTTATQSTTIGRFAPSANYFFNGQIDDVRIYSSVLTSTQAGYIADNDTGNIPTPQALYKLDNNSNDSAGSNHATWSGTAAYSDPAYTGQTLYNGTATDVGFVGTLFQPDLVWVKSRVGNYFHVLQDSVRGAGAGKSIYPNGTQTEGTYQGDGYISAINTNGFSVSGGASSSLQTNGSGVKYVAWCWKAASSDSTNTDGTITSTVRANQDAGFSIVKYAGNNTNSTVGHGLSSAPELVLYKNLDTATNWTVYNSALTDSYYLKLNATDGQISEIYNIFNGQPDASVLKLGSGSSINNSGDNFISYCFHSVDGYQKIGSYTGTGASGNAITTGFQPRWILIKRTDSTGLWCLFDSVRGTTQFLSAEQTTAEQTISSAMTFTSTGFTLTDTSANRNASNGVYIYLAIA